MIVLLAASALAGITLTLAGFLAGGIVGCVYVLIYAAACAPGLPVGFALFGRTHVAGWIAGALIGYALTAVAIWVPVQLRVPSAPAFAASWATAALLAYLCTRNAGPVVSLPIWTRRDYFALILVLFAVPALLWKPLGNIGRVDQEGNRRYRAYFTADFLWHVALTAELARFEARPRNPYLVRRPLNYYWAYFIPPAAISRLGIVPSVQACLTINAVCAGLLFVAAIFLCAWTAVPRAGPVAAGTLIALLGASAEGLHAAARLWNRGQSLEGVRYLNIDAITAWFHQGLTVDGLPRSLWYTPQHAAACGLSLIALIVPAAPPAGPAAGVLAGVALGFALIFSPFLGGAFSLIYGLTAVWVAWRSPGRFANSLWTTAPAAVPVIAALGWCVASGTFEGAGGKVAIGVSRLAAAAPLLAPALALGPVLAVALPGLFVRRPPFRTEAAAAALGVGLTMFYFVTLTSEPIWIGWRAGQILLVTLPGLAAATVAALADRGRSWAAGALVAAALCTGLPTTIIDAHNAQDVRNTAMGPGFRWTVVVTPDSQAALEWIRRTTPDNAVVQMSIAPRGRETWTLVPSFAERRMAAGQPISLLRVPEYETLSAEADAMFRTADAAEAARLARRLRIDFVYLDRVERDAFGEAAMAKFSDPRFFVEVFRQGPAAVYAVR